MVRVEVHGASIDPERIKRVIPIYQEGSVDEDLLNEGNRRLRDFYQRLGYFDARVDHTQQTAGADEVTILYTVQLGARRRVDQVSITGNHYFSTATLMDLISVHAADVLDRHGLYSQALVSADVSALENVYRNNGFSQVKVTPETSTPETADNSQTGAPAQQAGARVAPLKVVYRIVEGQQLRVGAMQLQGNAHIPTATLTALLNTAPGQMLSPRNLAGDHDAIVTEYLSRGFDQAAVNVTQQPEPADPGKVDVIFHIDEGPQTFVRNVLLTGLENTRPQTVAGAITVHAGDPLNQDALAATQSNLYSFALFNEVDTAVVNPTGDAPQKTVLIQAIEARRWTLTYGFGFEAQTGQPQNNCSGAFAAGVACNPNGKTGVSPRVLAAITRNGLFGRDQSASIRGTYGLLEQNIGMLYQVPHIEGNPNFGLAFSGGYANSEDVSTYVASRLEGAFRGTENFNHPGSWLSRANTFIYEIDFRRVKVAASSLQVYPGEISELSTATRVGGPAFTWIRDTRDVPLDAHRGTYTSFQEFLSDRLFGAQAEFNRIDVSNSSYYSFDKNRFVVARNTRYGQIRAFGNGSSELIPLPERLYAGGPVSLRGFSQNAAGPRDPETGYQIGGAGALINSTELRLPPPTLPWFGNTISFVIFHDMGNVFTNAGDAWASILRTRQPDGAACRNAVITDPTTAYPKGKYDPTGTGPLTSTGQQGPCSFNDFSHSLGAGLRYHTPVGPIRFDFSYNLNPPIYPVNINYSIPTAARQQYSRLRNGSVPRSGAAHQFLFQSGAGFLMHRLAPIRIGFVRGMFFDRARDFVTILSGAWGASAPCGVERPAVAIRPSAAAKFLVFALLFFAPRAFAAQQPDSPGTVVLDRAVAVVNKHVILASDLDDEIRLSVLDPNHATLQVLTRQQALDQLISRALIEQQIRQQDIEAIAPSQKEVDARLHEIRTVLPICIRQNCASDAGWKAFLAARGLTEGRVEAYLRYRLEILRFIEQRFRQGIQISPQQVETYYHDTLLPQYAPGETVPLLEQVAPRIQEILLQQQVNQLFDNWLTDLRRQGDVEVLDPDLVPEPAPAPAPAAQKPASPGSAEGGSR